MKQPVVFNFGRPNLFGVLTNTYVVDSNHLKIKFNNHFDDLVREVLIDDVSQGKYLHAQEIMLNIFPVRIQKDFIKLTLRNIVAAQKKTKGQVENFNSYFFKSPKQMCQKNILYLNYLSLAQTAKAGGYVYIFKPPIAKQDKQIVPESFFYFGKTSNPKNVVTELFHETSWGIRSLLLFSLIIVSRTKLQGIAQQSIFIKNQLNPQILVKNFFNTKKQRLSLQSNCFDHDHGDLLITHNLTMDKFQFLLGTKSPGQQVKVRLITDYKNYLTNNYQKCHSKWERWLKGSPHWKKLRRKLKRYN